VALSSLVYFGDTPAPPPKPLLLGLYLVYSIGKILFLFAFFPRIVHGYLLGITFKKKRKKRGGAFGKMKHLVFKKKI
jgi:hypothetical protein